jgi:hypothetical protein
LSHTHTHTHTHARARAHASQVPGGNSPSFQLGSHFDREDPVDDYPFIADLNDDAAQCGLQLGHVVLAVEVLTPCRFHTLFSCICKNVLCQTLCSPNFVLCVAHRTQLAVSFFVSFFVFTASPHPHPSRAAATVWANVRAWNTQGESCLGRELDEVESVVAMRDFVKLEVMVREDHMKDATGTDALRPPSHIPFFLCAPAQLLFSQSSQFLPRLEPASCNDREKH